MTPVDGDQDAGSAQVADAGISDALNNDAYVDDAGVPGEVPFIFTIKTDNEGESADTAYKIFTNPYYSYNYNVDCDSDGSAEATGQTGDYTCQYDSAGQYSISISGQFPAIVTEDSFSYQYRDARKLISVDQWGNMAWETMSAAFYGCENMNIAATDTPDLSQVQNMSYMFEHATAFNQHLRSAKRHHPCIPT